MAEGSAQRPMTRADFDGAICDEPGCLEEHELFIAQACHKGAELEAVYTKSDGVLELRCHACHNIVVQIQVAEGGENT